MNIPEDKRQVHPDLVTGFRKPRSTLEAEKYRLKAQEVGHERALQGMEDERTARAINFAGNFTQGAINFADQLIQNEAARQLEKAEVLVDDSFHKILVDLETNPYEENELRHESVWTESQPKIKEEVLKSISNSRAREIFEERYEKVSKDFGRKIQADARRRVKIQQGVDTVNNIEYWTGRGRLDKVEECLMAGKAGGLFEADDIDKIRDQAVKTVTYNQALNGAMVRITSEGPQDAIRWIYAEYAEKLSSNELSKIESAVNKRWDKQIEGVRETLWNAFLKNEIDPALIDKQPLPVKEKIEWYKLSESKTSAEEKGRQQEKYDALYDGYEVKAYAIDVTDSKSIEDFKKDVNLSKLDDPDKNRAISIVKDRISTHERELEERDESEEERLEKLQKEDEFRAYENIRTGKITDADQYRDKEEYKFLNEDSYKRLDTELEKRKKNKDPFKETDSAVEGWIIENWENEKVSNERMLEYINNHSLGKGLSNERAEHWKVVKLPGRFKEPKDQAKQDALSMINDEFKRVLKEENDFEKVTALKKEQSLMIQRYNDWYEKTSDADDATKLEKAKQMLDPFKHNWTSKLIDKLAEQREFEEGGAGYSKYMEHVGSPPVQTGKDQEGNPIFSDGKSGYRYNINRNRLEIYDTDKNKWLKVR